MINLDELKGVLEPLLDGREDAADVIEAVSALDKAVEVDRSEIDALNASWNERFKKAFFGEKADNISTEIPKLEEEPEGESGRDENYDGEDLTYEKLFTEVKEEKDEKED